MFRTTMTTKFLTDFNEQSAPTPSEFVIPEDVTVMGDEALLELHGQAVDHFTGIYGDGNNLTDEDVETLSALTDGIEGLNVELGRRKEAAAERAAKAGELASRVNLSSEATDEAPADEDAAEEDADADAEEDEDKDRDESTEDEGAANTVTASARREVRVNVSRKNSRFVPSETPKTMKDVVFASEGVAGYGTGQGVNWNDIGKILDHRLRSYSEAQYSMAAKAGKSLRQQLSLATFRKPTDPDLTINNNDPAHIRDIVERAVSEKRLKGGSLVASGGWCAPSETLYDLVELESRDGLFDLPEVGIARGGINRTLGPSFADIFADIKGWTFTEEQDIAGDYDGGGR